MREPSGVIVRAGSLLPIVGVNEPVVPSDSREIRGDGGAWPITLHTAIPAMTATTIAAALSATILFMRAGGSCGVRLFALSITNSAVVMSAILVRRYFTRQLCTNIRIAWGTSDGTSS